MLTEHTQTLDKSQIGTRVNPLKVLITSGPDTGKTLEIQQGTVLVGTHVDCQLQLTDAAVSRRHCSLEVYPQGVRVKDLNSKNGTRYLGARITSVDVPLGGSIELGSSTLTLTPVVRESAVSDKSELGLLVGRSLATRRLFARLEQLAPSDATVLIHGETGVGKEAVARTLHTLSRRATGPFVTFDCGASTASLVQSVLFGHVRGAFTGAVKDAVGLIEAANTGVLFLDEVSALPLELQPVLLRVLESRSFQRVGEAKPRTSDFQLIASTSASLPDLVREGTFRADLFYRLSAITLEVLPLRERVDDIPLLAQHFVKSFARAAPLSSGALAALCAWRWPGNVRELRNAIERVVTLGEHPTEVAVTSQPEDFHVARERALAAFEKSYLEALLEKHGGSASSAAKEAGIARSYLYKLLEQHGVALDRFRPPK